MREEQTGLKDASGIKIGFIGAGNMGGAILGGYCDSSDAVRENIYVCGRNREKNLKLANQLEINFAETAAELVKKADLIFLGVEPKDAYEVLDEIKEEFNQDKTLVSMVTGLSMPNISRKIGSEAAIIRIMPNTPSRIGAGIISVSENDKVDKSSLSSTEKILSNIGDVQRVDEDLIHCVIGVSGSSPAYTYLYIDALIEAAVENGMDREKATIFAAKAVAGAAEMVLRSGEKPQVLADKVCSEGGTTIEAVKKLNEMGFSETVTAAFQAAVDRSIEMTEERK